MRYILRAGAYIFTFLDNEYNGKLPRSTALRSAVLFTQASLRSITPQTSCINTPDPMFALLYKTHHPNVTLYTMHEDSSGEISNHKELFILQFLSHFMHYLTGFYFELYDFSFSEQSRVR